MEDAWKTSKYVLKITLNMLKMLRTLHNGRDNQAGFDTSFLGHPRL